MATLKSGLNSGAGFNSSDTITSTTLNNHVNDGGIVAGTILTADMADSSSKITGVTFAKMQHIDAEKVLARTTSGEGDIEEIDIAGASGILLDEDNLSSDSATRGATQQSIKAYVDDGGGFTPSSYADEESVTLPNGLIMKMGKTSVLSADSLSSAISFGTPFNAVPVSIVITKELGLQTGGTGEMTVTDVTASSFKIANGGFAGAFYFQAIGR